MANQYTTLALVQAELQGSEITASTTPSSSQVTTWIEEASAEIEIMTGEVFTSTTVSSEYLDYNSIDRILRIPKLPLISVTSVEYNKENNVASSADWVTLEEGQGKNYLVYKDEGEIEFISGNSATNKLLPKSGNKRIRVSYVYGHNSTPLEIQRLATLMVAYRTISSLVNSQANTEGGSVTVGPITVQDPTNFSVNYVKNLQSQIQDLKNNIGHGFKTFRSGRVY